MDDVLRDWRTVDAALTANPFNHLTTILSAIAISADDARSYFLLDYSDAVTDYSNNQVQIIFDMIAKTNAKRYAAYARALAAEYDLLSPLDVTETRTQQRTPNLTHQTTGSGTEGRTETVDGESETTGSSSSSSSGTSAINQTATTTETPQGWQETRLHSVNPYDNPGMQPDNQDQISRTGSTQTTTVYSGNPDATTTTATGSDSSSTTGSRTTTDNRTTSTTETRTETGTDTTTTTIHRTGDDGRETAQQLIAAEIDLADRLNIYRIIARDIAAKLFLQVW